MICYTSYSSYSQFLMNTTHYNIHLIQFWRLTHKIHYDKTYVLFISYRVRKLHSIAAKSQVKQTIQNFQMKLPYLNLNMPMYVFERTIHDKDYLSFVDIFSIRSVENLTMDNADDPKCKRSNWFYNSKIDECQ